MVPFLCIFTNICCFWFCPETHSDLVWNEQLLFWHAKDAEQFFLYLVAILLLFILKIICSLHLPIMILALLEFNILSSFL